MPWIGHASLGLGRATPAGGSAGRAVPCQLAGQIEPSGHIVDAGRMTRIDEPESGFDM